MSKKKIIIDCDPGHDDAIALILALSSEKLEVEGIGTTAGNQTQEKVFKNLKKILSLLGREDIKIGRGCEKPLVHPLLIAEDIHGESGLDGTHLKEPPEGSFKEYNSLELFKTILEESRERLTIVATGPLTNVALLILTYPHLLEKVEEISLMGGACFGGNRTINAEFNIYVDPEAAKIVFDSGIPIVMSGLDVTHKAQMFNGEIAQLKGEGYVGDFLYDSLRFYREKATPYFLSEEGEEEGAHLHDPCAVSYLIDSSNFIGRKLHVEIETNRGNSLGQTIVDYNDIFKKEKNVYVLFDVKRENLIAQLFDACRYFKTLL